MPEGVPLNASEGGPPRGLLASFTFFLSLSSVKYKSEQFLFHLGIPTRIRSRVSAY